MNDIKFIYDKLKDKYDLTLTSTLALNDGYTIDAPVIRGCGANGSFGLYHDGAMLVFSVEYFDKEGNDKYSHGHPYDLDDAINYIENFMQGKSIFN
jgi:hypothetical protein